MKDYRPLAIGCSLFGLAMQPLSLIVIMASILIYVNSLSRWKMLYYYRRMKGD